MGKCCKSIMFLWIRSLVAGCMLATGCGPSRPVDKNAGEEIVAIDVMNDPNPIRTRQIDLFEKTHPHIRVNRNTVRDVGAKVLVNIAGGIPPDVFFIMDFNLVDFAKRNALEPLDDYIANDPEFNVEDYFPEVLEGYRYKNRLYALPGNCTPHVLYYNKMIFDEAGVAYPSDEWTWEDLLESARNLTKTDERGNVRQFGFLTSTWLGNLLPFIFQSGGKIYNPDGTRCVINNAPTKEALIFAKDLSEKYHVSPRGSDFQSSAGINFFRMGKAAMMADISGRWRTIELRESSLSDDFRIAELFHGKNKGTLLSSMGWAIPRTAKHKKEAWEFVKFLCQGKSLELVIDSGDGVPPLVSLASSDRFLVDPKHPNEDNNVYLRSLAYAQRWPVSPYVTYAETMQIFQEEFDKFVLGRQGIDETLTLIETSINKIIRQNREEKR